MPYIVLWGNAYDELAEHITKAGGRAYRHYDDIEEAGADAPFTSVHDYRDAVSVRYEHPDETRSRSGKLPHMDVAGRPETARSIVAFAANQD